MDAQLKPLATMDRNLLAQILDETGLLMDLTGENPFKVRAFQNGARIIETFQGDLEKAFNDGSLAKVKGIGAGLLEKITEFQKSGKIADHEKLRSKIPTGVVDMLSLTGLGPKKVRVLYEKLDIKSVGELEYACKENRLVKLDGFGEKTQEKILKSIEFKKKHQNNFLYSDAILEAQLLVSALKKVKGVEEISVGGSLRRCKEVIRDIDILVSSHSYKPIAEKFLANPNVESITANGDTKISVVLKNGMACDLRIVKPEEFPFALLYFTGSKEHNDVMRQIAKDKGYKLNEYGLTQTKKDKEVPVQCGSEKEIFKFLGMEYIPPEMRENCGEIEVAQKNQLPTLIERDELKGVFHCHTTDSDGTNSLEEMVGAAQTLGFEYIGISDHSASAEVYANGMRKERVMEQFKRIETLQKKFKIKIFKGIESDILAEGALDYENEFLAKFDFIIGSLHGAFSQTKEKMTARVLNAFSNPFFDFFGHPTARILLARDGVSIDIHKVIDESIKLGVVMELNAHPQRLDLDWRYGKYLQEKGGRVSINPDAHSVAGLEDVEYGIGIARKAWLGTKNVINTLPANKVLQSLRSYKSRNA